MTESQSQNSINLVVTWIFFFGVVALTGFAAWSVGYSSGIDAGVKKNSEETEMFESVERSAMTEEEKRTVDAIRQDVSEHWGERVLRNRARAGLIEQPEMEQSMPPGRHDDLPRATPQRKSQSSQPTQDLEVRMEEINKYELRQSRLRPQPAAEWRVYTNPPQQFSEPVRPSQAAAQRQAEFERRQAEVKTLDNQFMHQLNTIDSSNMPEAIRDAEHQMLWDRYTQERFGR